MGCSAPASCNEPYQSNKHQNNLWSKQSRHLCLPVGRDVSFEHTALCITDQYRWFGLRRFDNMLMGHNVPFSVGMRSASLIRQCVLVLRLDWGTVTDLCVPEVFDTVHSPYCEVNLVYYHTVSYLSLMDE